MLLRIPYAPGMVDQLERTTNLLALLLETRVPLTLDDIVNQLARPVPGGHAAMRGAFERDKGLLRDIGVPIETEVLARHQRRADRRTAWIAIGTSCATSI